METSSAFWTEAGGRARHPIAVGVQGLPQNEDCGMYLDNNQLNKPRTNGARVYTVSYGESSLATKKQLIKKYSSMYNEEVGLLEGEYHIHLGSTSRAATTCSTKGACGAQGGSSKSLNDILEGRCLLP